VQPAHHEGVSPLFRDMVCLMALHLMGHFGELVQHSAGAVGVISRLLSRLHDDQERDWLDFIVQELLQVRPGLLHACVSPPRMGCRSLRHRAALSCPCRKPALALQHMLSESVSAVPWNTHAVNMWGNGCMHAWARQAHQGN
jgi:hypothetical protein